MRVPNNIILTIETEINEKIIWKCSVMRKKKLFSTELYRTIFLFYSIQIRVVDIYLSEFIIAVSWKIVTKGQRWWSHVSFLRAANISVQKWNSYKIFHFLKISSMINILVGVSNISFVFCFSGKYLFCFFLRFHAYKSLLWKVLGALRHQRSIGA